MKVKKKMRRLVDMADYLFVIAIMIGGVFAGLAGDTEWALLAIVTLCYIGEARVAAEKITSLEKEIGRLEVQPVSFNACTAKGLKDHQIQELVNRIRDRVQPLTPVQSLRTRISNATVTYLEEKGLRIDYKESTHG